MLTSLGTILAACERSGTVRRLVYTGSFTTASPLEEDGLRFRGLIDESCWTSPELPIAYGHDHVKFYVSVKTELEKQLTSYGDNKEGKDNSVEVVVLTCGLVGGWALVDDTAVLAVPLSPITGDSAAYRSFWFLQKLLCSVPLVHVDDVCEAHLFCMGVPLSCGRRFLCAAAYPSLWEILSCYRQRYPDLVVVEEPEEPPVSRKVTGGSKRLEHMGFQYKYGVEQTIDDSVQHAKKLGVLKHR